MKGYRSDLILFNVTDSFWSKVRKGSRNECWIWTAGVSHNGHGVFRKRNAHRFAWEVSRGKIPEGVHVLHKCNNKLCVNPNHLYLGDHCDNMKDMVIAGQGKQKLSIDEIHSIMDLWESGKHTKTSIGKILKIDPGHVGKIIKGKTILSRAVIEGRRGKIAG